MDAMFLRYRVGARYQIFIAKSKQYSAGMKEDLLNGSHVHLLSDVN